MKWPVADEKTFADMKSSIERFPLEILHRILLLLDPKSVVAFKSCSSHCKLIAGDSFWRLVLLRELGIPGFSSLSEHPYKLFKELKLIEVFPFDEAQLQRSIEQSSFDNMDQKAENILSDSQRTFYSSVGTDADMNEFVEFLFFECTLVRSVILKPFLAQFQRGTPCYSPIAVSFTYSIDQSDENTTREYPMQNIPLEQRIDLEKAIITKRLKINLIKKQQTQPSDERYYTCLERVKIYGASWFSTAAYPEIQQTLFSYSNLFVDQLRTSTSLMSLDQKMLLQSYRQHQQLRQQFMQNLNGYNQVAMTTLFRLLLPRLRTKEFYTILVDALGIERFVKHFSETVDHMIRNRVNFTRDEAIILALICATDFSTVHENAYQTQQNMPIQTGYIRYDTDHNFILKALGKFRSFINPALVAPETKLPTPAKLIDMLATAVREELIESTLELGLLLELKDSSELAHFVYTQGHCLDKILELFIASQDYGRVAEISLSIYTINDFVSFLRNLAEQNYDGAVRVCSVVWNRIQYNRIDNDDIRSIRTFIREILEVPPNISVEQWFVNFS